MLAAIQLEVSESSSHFLIHLRRRAQRTGSCQLLPQAKQNVWPQRHVTGRASTCCTRITDEQSGLGHHRSNRLHCAAHPTDIETHSVKTHRNAGKSNKMDLVFTSADWLDMGR